MKMMIGTVNGITVAEYKKAGCNFKFTCKVSNGFYCITFYNGRQSYRTRYTKDKNEANAYVKEHIIADGFYKVK